MKTKIIQLITVFTIIGFLLSPIKSAIAKKHQLYHKWYRVTGMPIDAATSYVPYLIDSVCAEGSIYICTIVDEADASGMYPKMSWGLVSTHTLLYEVRKRRYQ